MFVGLHVLLAEQTNTPEIAMSEEEGKQFMSAAQNVLRHYSVETTQKTLDTIAFAGVCMGIYAPRVAAYGARKRYERMKPVQRPQGAAPDNVNGAMVAMSPPPMDTGEHAGF